MLGDKAIRSYRFLVATSFEFPYQVGLAGALRDD